MEIYWGFAVLYLLLLLHIAWLLVLMIPPEEESNFETFRDCLSTVLIERLAPATAKPKKKVKGRKTEIKPVVRDDEGKGDEADAAELSEFTEVCIPDVRCIIHIYS